MDSIYSMMATLQSHLAVGIEYLINVKGFIWLQLVISAITIWMTLMAGNKHPKAWLVGLANQGLWAVMIVWTQSWGLVPLCLAMCLVYYRNHAKWKMDQLIQQVRQPHVYPFPTRDDFPTIGQVASLYLDKSTGKSYIWVNHSYQLL